MEKGCLTGNITSRMRLQSDKQEVRRHRNEETETVDGDIKRLVGPEGDSGGVERKDPSQPWCLQNVCASW